MEEREEREREIEGSFFRGGADSLLRHPPARFSGYRPEKTTNTRIMLKTVFSFDLAEKILPGRVAIGFFDGTNPCLVAATTADKVLIHNPHERSKGNLAVTSGNKSFLNINQTIQVLTAGCLRTESKKEVLVIGTPTSIMAYDVENNTGSRVHKSTFRF